MRNPRPTCPNEACENHVAPPAGFYRKKGYRRPVNSPSQKIPRYQCKTCGAYFSATRAKGTHGQRRPDLNREIFKLAVSGVSMRRIVALLGCHHRTVAKKITLLAEQAQVHHAERMKSLRTTCVMIDELETFMHSRYKQLSVSMVVRVKTGEVLGFGVAKKPCNQPRGQIKYKWTQDDRPQAFYTMLRSIEPALAPGCTVITDGHPSYRKWLGKGLASYQHRVLHSPNTPGYDPLFVINHTFAKMRNDLARLGRKTWTTTKTVKGLEDHLWLWVAWTNGYRLR
ncbi:MAG: hypothetical protein ACOH1P_08195 [Lysobacter sp.]